MGQVQAQPLGPGSSSPQLESDSSDVTNDGFVRLVEFIKKEHLKRKATKKPDQKSLPAFQKYKAAIEGPESEKPQKGLQLDKSA
jgi:hypothetical protein